MTKQVSTDTQLLKLYNEVDAFLRKQYRQDTYADHLYLIQELASSNRVVARYQQEMRAVAQLRNSLIHNPFSNAQPLALPNPELITTYQAIRDALIKPSNALSIAIPASKIYTVTLGTNLNEVLRNMDKHTYTHVPVMDGKSMVGLLSENTLLSYLAEIGEAVITNDMTVNDLQAYLPLESHRSESFVFLPRKTSLNKIFEVFNQAISEHKRIGMVFLTEHGKPHEKPLGIITAWDLASPELEQR